MKQLKFKVKQKKYPYNDLCVNDWYDIKLLYGQNIISSCEWHLSSLIEWIEKCNFNLDFDLPIKQFDNVNSIYENCLRLRSEFVERNNFNNLELLENYTEYHALRLPGSKFGIYYIGRLRNGIGELSWKKDKEIKCLIFDMDNFLAHLDCLMKSYCNKK